MKPSIPSISAILPILLALSFGAESLLKNPGFEEELGSEWVFNNWAKNDASFARDAQEPHRGQYAYRLTLAKITGAAAVELYAPLAALPGKKGALRFWARGNPAGAKLHVSLRNAKGAYKLWFGSEIALKAAWTEVVLPFELAPEAPLDGLGLFFILKDEGSVWLDDVGVGADAAAPAEPTPIGVNLLANPGFEEELGEAWRPNNWAKNEAQIARDASSPHGGKQSLRMSLKKITGVPALELIAPVKLNPGDLVELRFWMRGGANLGSVEFSLRPLGPWKQFFRSEVTVLESWTEYVVAFVVPAGVNRDDLGLFFNLPVVNTIELDDVSLMRLPPKDPAAPRPGNLVKNGSFEVGRMHWTGLRRGGGGGYRVDTLARESDFDFSAGEMPGAPAGKRALSFQLPTRCSFNLTSAYARLRYGYPVTLGFSLKSPTGAHRILVQVGSGKITPEWSLRTNAPCSPGQWDRRNFTFIPKPSGQGTYFIEFSFEEQGDWALDQVTLVEGERDLPDARPASREAALAKIDDTHPGNVYFPGEAVAFDLLGGEGDLDLRVVDAWDRVVEKRACVAKGPASPPRLAFPSAARGAFKVELREAGKERVLSETLYSVVPRLKPAREVVDSFFGTHATFSDYGLDLCEKIGFRWLRAYPPHVTAWYLIEETPGDYLWMTNRVATVAGRGFKILGLFNTTPAHAGDGDPGKKSSIWFSYPPKDYGAWREYVKRAAEVFGPWIKDWEVWNEPDGNYLLVKKGTTDKPGVYLRLVEETRLALEEAGARVNLLAGSVGNPVHAFFDGILQRGLSAQVDGISHHWYFENQSPDQLPAVPFTVQAGERFGKMKGRGGKTPELWQTEGGIYLNGALSWMTSWEIPPGSPYGPLEAAGTLVRTVASLKAAGYRRNFFYAFMAEKSGRISYLDWCAGILDVDGTPHSGFAAHAVAVSCLEEANAAGFLVPEIAGTPKGSVFVARFLKAGKPLSVVWSRKPIPLSSFPPELWRGCEVFDLMGNPVAQIPSTRVDLCPVYLVGR